jgi:hypothetical protein
MATLSDAPLRAEVRNGQIYLGVRNWSTYFFEKIVASDKELEQAKLKTQIAIETHVRAFLNSPDGAIDAVKEELIMNLLHTRTTERLVTRPVILKSKNEPDTKPESKTEKKIRLDKVFDKPSNGAILVQRGVSIAQPSALEQARPALKEKAEWVMGVVSALFNPLNDKNLNLWIRRVVNSAIKPAITNSTLHVIADVRLVRKETNRSATTDLLDRGNIVELQYTDAFKNFGNKDAFKDYYKNQLNNVAGTVKSTLLLELPYDNDPVCTDANVYGAVDAAHEFIEKQKLLGKTVSVMIVVPSLPIGRPKSEKRQSPDGASDNVRQSKHFKMAPGKKQGSDEEYMLDPNA